MHTCLTRGSFSVVRSGAVLRVLAPAESRTSRSSWSRSWPPRCAPCARAPGGGSTVCSGRLHRRSEKASAAARASARRPRCALRCPWASRNSDRGGAVPDARGAVTTAGKCGVGFDAWPAEGTLDREPHDGQLRGRPWLECRGSLTLAEGPRAARRGSTLRGRRRPSVSSVERGQAPMRLRPVHRRAPAWSRC